MGISEAILFRLPPVGEGGTNAEAIELARELGRELNRDVENGFVWVYNNVLERDGEHQCSFSLIEDSTNVLTESVRGYLFTIQEQINQIRRDQITQLGLERIVRNLIKKEKSDGN